MRVHFAVVLLLETRHSGWATFDTISGAYLGHAKFVSVMRAPVTTRANNRILALCRLKVFVATHQQNVIEPMQKGGCPQCKPREK